jgi:hypothetical protein
MPVLGLSLPHGLGAMPASHVRVPSSFILYDWVIHKISTFIPVSLRFMNILRCNFEQLTRLSTLT